VNQAIIADLRDSQLVWKVQSYFGVRRIAEVQEGPPDKPWVAIPISQAPETVQKSTEIMKEGTEGLRQRIDATKSNEKESEGGFSSSGYGSETDKEGKNVIYYEITNYFWYVLFFIGSQLGDEAFYAFFFSFWFWNIDGFVGRRIVLVWNLVMYIGQGFKDIIRWPRPNMPPVVKLEKKFALEYGMPSTHSMLGFALPVSVIIFTIDRYVYDFWLLFTISCFWCSLVCLSRMYVGMHSLADIIGGLFSSCLVLPLVLPLVHFTDYFLLSSPLAPTLTVTLSVLAIWLYPGSDKWTPARGETTIVLGCYLGAQLGNWLNFQCGIIQGVPVPPPYPVLWPTFHQYGEALLRFIIGGVICVATRAIFKPVSFLTACYILETDRQTLQMQEFDVRNKKKLLADLFYKFMTYTAIGFNVVFTSPVVFRVLGCERPSFYTEL